MIRYKYARDINAEFSATLKKRVNEYFTANNIQKEANSAMVIKTIIAHLVYLVPFAFIMSGTVTAVPLLFLLWGTMGFGKAFIGLSVMHDMLHGSYTKKSYLSGLMNLPAYIIGVDPKIWQMQHNVLHHTYTNIEGADEDIQPRFVMRFSPNQPRHWFHRYQHIYVLFFYGISTLIWVTFKDFGKLASYKKLGLVKGGASFTKRFISIFIRKVLYLTVFLVLPIMYLEQPAGLIVAMFITMHFVTGICLSMVFQPAHVMPTSIFVDQEEEQIKQNFAVHQLLTTANFGMSNKVLSWFVGGLNFQVEHHLFPDICHVHYPAISKIVQEVTKEYDLPYYALNYWGDAVSEHFNMLKSLGRSNSYKPKEETLLSFA